MATNSFPITVVRTAKQQREGGGFMVRRPLGGALPTQDPLLMLDHFGPVNYKPGEAVGAPDHPHRGQETVTYMLKGEMEHKDSQGNSGVIKSGDVQWMTAGAGVVHSEMPSEAIMKNGGESEGFQLWVNLPRKDKMMRPRYQDIPKENMPERTSKDGKVQVKVLAGSSMSTTAVIDTRTPIMYLHFTVHPTGTHQQTIPLEYQGLIYVFRGKGQFGSTNTEIGFGQAGLIPSRDSSTELSIKNAHSEELQFLLIAGVPLNEPVVWKGPFVMNTQEEIEQCYTDYQSGKLGSIPGSYERYEQTRNARKVQGMGDEL